MTRKRLTPVLAAAALLIGALSAAPAKAAPVTPVSGGAVDVYTGELTTGQVALLNRSGLDQEDITIGDGRGGRFHVEAVLNGTQVAALARQGLRLDVKKVQGKDVAQRLKAAPPKVFRPYSGQGNIREELLKVASDHPSIATAVDIGKSGQGKPITAVRVSKDVRNLKDRERPVVVYQATQHAREWITPEMVRRLLHHYVDGYGEDTDLTRIIDTTDLWFVPVVNVDGYDLTFTDGFRLWRKNTRDNNGDGRITNEDGVDLNRNFTYKWGYDNEGSSPDPANLTYRGPSPASEPETRAQIGLYKRLRPTFLVNYHSAAELLLHGVGWQALTRSPDDLIHEALLGDALHPAVPGYTPELGAQLYTTNGDTDGEADNNYGALSITPEMATCKTAANTFPDDEWTPEKCGSVFEFPDDERLIAHEFQKNLPFALSVGKSAPTPDDPVSVVGRTVPDFERITVERSFGATQEVSAYVRRSLENTSLYYKINKGPVQRADVHEWRGGERFGHENDTYFGEYRGKVTGQKPDDSVEYWFAGDKDGKRVESRHDFYLVLSQDDADVLVIADEDVHGVNPIYPPWTHDAKYGQQYTDLVKAAGHKAFLWDLAWKAPPQPATMKHFKAVIWYLGDNRLTQNKEDEPVKTHQGDVPDSQVSDQAKDLVLAMRSYLNEGGKLLHTGETAGYFGPLSKLNGGGIYYGLKGRPEYPCVVTGNYRDDCELLSDDFYQYYLGAFDRLRVGSPTRFAGTGRPFDDVTSKLADVFSNRLDEAGGFQVTSTVLPEDDFPQFASWKAGEYPDVPAPGEPFVSAVATRDTILLGFGVEQMATPAEQRTLVTRALDHLLG